MKTVNHSDSVKVTPASGDEPAELNPFPAGQYPVYHELSDSPVVFKTLEEEFLTRLALVEDLHKRFHFMVQELQSVGLKVEDDK